MGILQGPAAYVEALKLPPGFSVCELGNQEVSGVKAWSARKWYESLGCGRYESIDANGRGTFTADLNNPLPGITGLWHRFDLVTDFGTGEHIFDQAQVWRTIHQLTIPGGHIVFDRPTNGYGKHCFYLTTEVLFKDLAAANGYMIRTLEKAQTPRGWLIRGIFRTPRTYQAFRVPHQGRYQASSKLEVSA